MTKEDLLNIAEAAPFFSMVLVFRALPRIPALHLGKLLGRYSRYFLPTRLKTTCENLHRAYPNQDNAWVKHQAKLVFEHLGVSAVEMLCLDHLNSRTAIEKLITFEGLEHLQQLKADNQDAFLLTAHLGFWECGTIILPLLGFPADYVTKTIRNPYVDRFFRQQREASGGRCIDSKHGARRILKSLAKKRFVCLLLDQHISKKRAVIVDFFNRPAYATPIIPQIALKNKTPIVPIFCYRNPDFSYRVIVEEPIVFTDELTDESIQKCTQQLTDIIEAAVRKQPHQWFWVHRRWRKSAEKK
ncbi:MAG: lysophospholipid acyltransferase family protein [Desulfuromonas sp.]|nr:lysophospholipid acyltransferase family protein [Desulfuromonas sp.]